MPPGSRGKMARRNEALRERFAKRTGLRIEPVVYEWQEPEDATERFNRTLARAELLLQDDSYDYGINGADGILVVTGEVSRLGRAEVGAISFAAAAKKVSFLFGQFIRENPDRLARAMSGDLELARDFWRLFEVTVEQPTDQLVTFAAPNTQGPRRFDLD